MLHYQKGNLTVFQSTLYKTTTAIIESEKTLVMTDPNWLPSEIKEIKKYIAERIGDKKLYIIYTHSDFDHIIGAGAFPEAETIASKAFHMNAHKEQAIKECAAFDSNYYIERDYEIIYPQVDHIIEEDGQKLSLEDLVLTFYQAPGHTSDGLFTVVEPQGVFLAGDYLSDVEFPFIYSGYKDYLKTLDKAENIMEDFDVQTLVPGHGNVTILKDEIWNRINFSKYYLNQLLVNSNLEKECRKRFSFFEGMKESHSNNIKQAKMESTKHDI